MNIISVPISGASLSFEYKTIFTEIIKQYSLLGANEDGRNDIAEIREVDDASEIKDYVKDHTIFLLDDSSFTGQVFRTFMTKYSNAGLLRFDADYSLLQLVRNSITPVIKPNQIIFAATRTWNREEADYVRTQKVNHFSMKKLFELGIDEATDTLMESARNYGALYISIGISCLDPAFVNSEKKEPGGLTTRELLYMLQRLKLLKNLKMADITGFSEERDANTAKLVAKIIKELS